MPINDNNFAKHGNDCLNSDAILSNYINASLTHCLTELCIDKTPYYNLSTYTSYFVLSVSDLGFGFAAGNDICK